MTKEGISMHSKNINNIDFFNEKYPLYSSMLYKLGLVYLGTDGYAREAMDEALLWLLTRKKSFKDPYEERLELIRHMILICEIKSRRKPGNMPEMEEETSHGTSLSDSMNILEAIYGLPKKYKPVLHLALYENLDVHQISKILYRPTFVIKRLLAKGTELMEMVLERKLYKDHYCRMMNEFRVPSYIKEEVYLYLTEGKPHVKAYLSHVQKVTAALGIIAVAVLSIAVMRLYPVLKPVINTKYAFMNGTIRSITFDSIYETNVPGVFFAYSENGYQGCTLDGDSLEQLETRHITKTIDYAGQEFAADFYYCIKDGYLAVLDHSKNVDHGVVYIESQYYTDGKVLVTLYLYNFENDEESFIYPLIMDINTLETTDFISSCGISDFGQMMDINLNASLPGAIIKTKDGEIYYLDIKSSSHTKLGNNDSSNLDFAYFYNDETIIYSIMDYKASESCYVISCYEYSISTNTVTKLYEYNYDGSSPDYFNGNTILLSNPDSTFTIMDIRTGKSTSIPNIQKKDGTYFIVQYSPDGRHILFEYKYNDSKLSKELIKTIYIYDIEANETIILNPSDYKDVYFFDSFWYDNSHIALWKDNGTPKKIGPAFVESDSVPILWIFDINKLK